jgi:alkanesulfonate monooxygenase SsuD/methylene tetrahydromethanopterin reductase-like flavin-dependent oxidoreductase (luciferase family)
MCLSIVMKIGVGLPATIPGVPRSLILDWARQAEKGPFSSLGMIDRVVYQNYEPLITLAAVAGVTERIRLITTVLVAPPRSTGLFAKQCASLDVISNGRLTLGLGLGNREDDYAAAGVSFKERGKLFDRQLEALERVWSGQALSDSVGAIGPQPVQNGGPELLIGGYSDAAIHRIKRWGHGFISGMGDAQRAEQSFRQVEKAWQEAGRHGKPRLVGGAYFMLGPDARDRASKYILDYYTFAGSKAQTVLSSIPDTEERLRSLIKAFAEIGTDELVLWPCIPDTEQLTRLTELIR